MQAQEDRHQHTPAALVISIAPAEGKRLGRPSKVPVHPAGRAILEDVAPSQRLGVQIELIANEEALERLRLLSTAGGHGPPARNGS